MNYRHHIHSVNRCEDVYGKCEELVIDHLEPSSLHEVDVHVHGHDQEPLRGGRKNGQSLDDYTSSENEEDNGSYDDCDVPSVHEEEDEESLLTIMRRPLFHFM